MNSRFASQYSHPSFDQVDSSLHSHSHSFHFQRIECRRQWSWEFTRGLHSRWVSCLIDIHSLHDPLTCILYIFFIFFIISTIEGRIDQVNQVLELNQQRQGTARYNALDNWTYQLSSLHLAIANKMAWLSLSLSLLYILSICADIALSWKYIVGSFCFSFNCPMPSFFFLFFFNFQQKS